MLFNSNSLAQISCRVRIESLQLLSRLYTHSFEPPSVDGDNLNIKNFNLLLMETAQQISRQHTFASSSLRAENEGETKGSKRNELWMGWDDNMSWF